MLPASVPASISKGVAVLVTKSSVLQADSLEPSYAAEPSAAETLERDSCVRRERFIGYLIVLTLFWAFIAGTNVLYGNTMQASMEMMGVKHMLTPWHARLLQHVILYPGLVAFVWLALRMDWHPLGLALAVQALCATTFSLLATPALVAAEALVRAPVWSPPGMPPIGRWQELFSAPGLSLWITGISTFLLIYCFAVALVTGFSYYRRYRDAELRSSQLQESLVAAQLAGLRMQLSPHTLFNLLHAIRGYVGWDPPAAQAMVVQLADLLRRVLRAGELDVVPLAEELESTRLYLQLQWRRFPDRLSIEIDNPPGAARYWVPSLILQPLIENAVVHGMDNHDLPVQIRVAASVSAERITLRVTNTVKAGQVANRAGIGLSNVRRRLSLQYAGRAAFTAGMNGQHWEACISMPLVYENGGDHRDALDRGGTAGP